MEHLKKLKDYPIEIESIVLFTLVWFSSVYYLQVSSIKQLFTAYSLCCMWFIVRKLASASPIKVYVVAALAGVLPVIFIFLMLMEV